MSRSTLSTEVDARQLDHMIWEFEDMVRTGRGIMGTGILGTTDWRPHFAKAKEIQEAFNSRVHYPTKQEREAAWIRFNDLRTRVYEVANAQRTAFRENSERLRDQVLQHIKYAGYSKMTDVLFFFDPTTVADMKAKGERLREGGQMLSSNKQLMLKEHKDECFMRIQELRKSHDAFWEQYKAHLASRQAEYQAKKAAHEERRSEIARRIESNIRSNSEKLEKAQAAYSRVRSNLESNLEKLETAYSPAFIERVTGWISEDKDKLRSISDSIERISAWIEEDATRLRDIRNQDRR